jgi:hypothetical protein
MRRNVAFEAMPTGKALTLGVAVAVLIVVVGVLLMAASLLVASLFLLRGTRRPLNLRR